MPAPKNDSKDVITLGNKSKLSLPSPKNNIDEVIPDDGNEIKISKNDDKEKEVIPDCKSPPKKVLKRRNRDLYATNEEEDE